MQDLPILLHKIESLGQRLTGLGRDIRSGQLLGDVADRLAEVAELAMLVDDYRQTRSRCVALHQGLTRSGDSPALGKVNFPHF